MRQGRTANGNGLATDLPCLPNHRLQCIGCVLLESRQFVAVGAERQGYVAMSEALGHDARVDTIGE